MTLLSTMTVMGALYRIRIFSSRIIRAKGIEKGRRKDDTDINIAGERIYEHVL